VDKRECLKKKYTKRPNSEVFEVNLLQELSNIELLRLRIRSYEKIQQVKTIRKNGNMLE
jgi:hypothetical protein